VGVELLPQFIHDNYEVREWKHACAILTQDFAEEWRDICEVLTAFRLRKSWITVGGGRKSKVSEAMDTALYARGWEERKFDTEIVIDKTSIESPTHSVDCFKNRVALEIEWNNKDPFYDRDLNNFRLLFELRAVSAGVIITRCDELQEKAMARQQHICKSCCHEFRAAAEVGAHCSCLVSQRSFILMIAKKRRNGN
jgi:hypothetical protein